MRYLIPAIALVLVAPLAAADPQSKNPGEAFLHTFDANHDGKVSRDEFIKPQVMQVQKFFDYLDKDHDGAIDSSEADTYAQEMQQRMQQLRQQHSGSDH
jgi:Ca2+-binding EF-hand superfamily protein